MKKENGITLIGLSVTIIVIVLITGVSLSMILGEKSLFSRVHDATVREDNVQVELAFSELVHNYIEEAGYRARVTGIDTYLKNNDYIDHMKISYGSRNLYKINLDTVLDGSIDTGAGIDVKEEEWEEQNLVVPEIEYMKDFYYVEIIKTSSETGKLVLLYMDKNAKEFEIFEFTDEFDVDNV